VYEIQWTPGRGAYGLFTLLAFVGFFVVRKWQPVNATSHPAIAWEQRYAIQMAAFVGGMFSAKLPFLFTIAGPPFSSTGWLTDGKTVTTGLAGAYLMVELTKWAMGIRVKTGDSFAIPLAVALAIGRTGCFFNGCCYGIPTAMPWGVDFFGDGLRHPTQLYEVVFHASIAVLLWRMAGRDQIPTHRLQFFLISYCAYRFMSEFLRPEPVLALGFTFYQWFCACFAVALAAQWIVSIRNAGEA
jgi:phosphatidylglycerol:prolipoprotein diacylglycerol transferase